ncbi:MAG: molybdopterin cofactor-binding domain-containing protein, partial [Actinomycetota bacterium]
RSESLTVTTQARDERHHARLGLDTDGRFTALTIDSVRNGGAHFAIFGGGPLFSCLGMAPGPYDITRYGARGRVVATTTVPTAAYRGFGQTQAAFIRERLIDDAARQLDVDPVELRRRNLVRPDQQPFTNRAGITYDNGDYAATLDAAHKAADAWPAPPDDGRCYGVGYATYVQMAGLGPSTINSLIGLSIGGFETAALAVDPGGDVEIVVGTVPHGQGHATSFARIVADRLGIDRARIRLAPPDTDRSPFSLYGTAASRSMAVGGAALVQAADRVADQLRALAADELEAAEVDIELVDGTARVRGGGGAVDIDTLARRAWQGRGLPAGLEPGLHARVSYDPPSCTFSFGTHVCRVAVDPDTGRVQIDRYHVVQDCGTVIDAAIVEGQTHGAIAQGATASVLEEVVVDDRANPLTGTLVSYLVPGPDFLPAITIEQQHTPSPYTPGGMKGIGEGGTNGAYAAVANAIAAAIPDAAADLTATPFSPQRIWNALRRSS